VKLADIDWRVLRGGIVMLLLSVLACGGLYVASTHFRDEMQQEYRQQNARFLNVSRQYLSVDQDDKIIKDLYPRFIELYKNGIVGREHRLNWLEVLKDVGEQGKIPSMTYEISSREAYTPPFPLPPGRFQVFASTMRLKVGMLHEKDLALLFSELDRKAAGIYTVKSCRLDSKVSSEQQAGLGQSEVKENVSAQCELQWFTLNLSSGEEIVVR
jgi:hypothetical protein